MFDTDKVLLVNYGRNWFIELAPAAARGSRQQAEAGARATELNADPAFSRNGSRCSILNCKKMEQFLIQSCDRKLQRQRCKNLQRRE
jgi:hypothetical protein